VAVVGCGGVGLSAVMGAAAAGAERIVAVDLSEEKAVAAGSFGATEAVSWQGSAEETADTVRELTAGGVDHAFEATGRPEAMLAAFLCTRTHGQAVLMGIAAEDAVLPLPARSIPRMERRVIGSLYGSARPDRDFPVILDMYRRGRLPLDRLISHRLPLEQIGEAFALLRGGDALRAVIDLEGRTDDVAA
jgi:alcohol dehydrogenase